MSIHRILWPKPIGDDAGVRELRERWDDVIGDDLIVVTAPTIRVARDAIRVAMPDADVEWYCLIKERSLISVEDTIMRLRAARERAGRGVRVIDAIAHDEAQRAARAKAIASLNFQRDFIFSDARPTVLLLRDGDEPWFSGAAADLWSFRQRVLHVSIEPYVRPPFLLPIRAGASRRLSIQQSRPTQSEIDALPALLAEFAAADRKRQAQLARYFESKILQRPAKHVPMVMAQASLAVFADAAHAELTADAPNWDVVSAGISAQAELDRLAGVPKDLVGAPWALFRRALERGAPPTIVAEFHHALVEFGRSAMQDDQLALATQAFSEAAAIPAAEPYLPAHGRDEHELLAELALLRGDFEAAWNHLPAANATPTTTDDQDWSTTLHFTLKPALRRAFIAACTGHWRAAAATIELMLATASRVLCSATRDHDATYDVAEIMLVAGFVRWVSGDEPAPFELFTTQWSALDGLVFSEFAAPNTSEPKPFPPMFVAALHALDALAAEDKGKDTLATSHWRTAIERIAAGEPVPEEEHQARVLARECAQSLEAFRATEAAVSK